jgi:hypothetical protein
VGSFTLISASLTSDVGVIYYGVAVGDNTGNSVSGANDVNTDGYADVVVGALNGNQGTGCAYIIFGSQHPSSQQLSNLGTSGYIINGFSANGLFGASVNRAGDFNSDGLPDVVIGAPGQTVGVGRSYVLYGQKYTTTIEVAALSASEGFVLVGGTFYQRSGWSVAATADSLNNVQVLIGSSPQFSSSRPVPRTSVYVYVPDNAVTGFILAPTSAPSAVPSLGPSAAPTTVPSPAPSAKPSTYAPTTELTDIPTVSPTSEPTENPTPKPTPSPTTVWEHEEPVILGTIVPFVTASLPICFSRQICEAVLDIYGIMTVDDGNSPILVIISRQSGINKVEKAPYWISWLRELCDYVYGADYKGSKIMERDFSEKYFAPRQDGTDAEAAPPISLLPAGSQGLYIKDIEMQSTAHEIASPDFRYEDVYRNHNIPPEFSEKYFKPRQDILDVGVSPPMSAGSPGSDNKNPRLKSNVPDIQYLRVPKEMTDVNIYLLQSIEYDYVSLKLNPRASTGVGMGTKSDVVDASAAPFDAAWTTNHVTNYPLTNGLQICRLLISNYHLMTTSVGGGMVNNASRTMYATKGALFASHLFVTQAMYFIGYGFHSTTALACTLIDSATFGSKLLTSHVIEQQYQLLAPLPDTASSAKVFMYCEASILSVNVIDYLTSLALQTAAYATGVNMVPYAGYSILMSTSVGASHCLSAYNSARLDVSDSNATLRTYICFVVDAVVVAVLLLNRKCSAQADPAAYPSSSFTVQAGYVVTIIYTVMTVNLLIPAILSIMGV